MKRIETVDALRAELDVARARADRIAFVPTMGALHAGHLSLVDRARALADIVVVSIFVNPLQFGAGEDLSRYPRPIERDAELLQTRGTDVLFNPSVEAMYPDGPGGVSVRAPALAGRLCGAFRPGHFDGVLTVVAKLFNIVVPEVAVFGQKDYQQALLIRRMVRDLDFPVRIDVAPIVRESDGLAMSSRNVYLSDDERQRATALKRALDAVQAAFSAGEHGARALEQAARTVLDAEAGIEVQYLELVEPHSLEPVDRAAAGTVVALAAFVGATRLIDNHILR